VNIASGKRKKKSNYGRSVIEIIEVEL